MKKIYIEVSKVFAEGYTVIETKNRLPKDINVIDLETWTQMGKVMQESIKKMVKTKLRWLHNFNDYRVKKQLRCLKLKNTGKSIAIQPKFEQTDVEIEEKKKKEMRGSMENERIAEKLRDFWSLLQKNEIKLQIVELN